MFGLEKGKQKPFEFDLEKDIKTNAKKTEEILVKIDGNINEIKSILREGSGSEDFDKFGVLLHGYTALRKVIDRAKKAK